MSRKVKVATCSVPLPQAGAGQGSLLRTQALNLVDEAGQRGADIVCLPEGCASDYADEVGTPDRVPGPITDLFGELADKYRMYVLVPLVEDVGEARAYNTTVLLDRTGRVAGRYRKTHLSPNEEASGKIMPGEEIPVLETDFCKIGITICMDIHFPELHTVLALKGAEIFFWPTAAIDYTGDLIESLVNARAVDNQVYFVCSHYIQQPYLAGKPYGRSRVVDPMGRIRADTGHFPGVAIADIDLDESYPMWYQGQVLQEYPTMRDTFFKRRQPALYSEVAAPLRQAHWDRWNTDK